jgi:hypothetical protein
MTYHWNTAFLLEKNAVDERTENLVEPPQVRPDDRAGDDHDDDPLERLPPCGPVDLPELGSGLADELTATMLGSPARLLLDRLLGRADLGLATASLARGAVGGRAGRTALPACLARHTYLVSRCGVWRPHQRQYFRNSTRSGEFRLDFCVW